MNMRGKGYRRSRKPFQAQDKEEEEEKENCGPKRGGQGSGLSGKWGRARAWRVSPGPKGPRKTITPTGVFLESHVGR